MVTLDIVISGVETALSAIGLSDRFNVVGSTATGEELSINGVSQILMLNDKVKRRVFMQSLYYKAIICAILCTPAIIWFTDDKHFT